MLSPALPRVDSSGKMSRLSRNRIDAAPVCVLLLLRRKLYYIIDSYMHKYVSICSLTDSHQLSECE